MTDDQLLRYSRHILLDEVGIEGQERILASHALIIGAGGLGSPAALYLGSAGVGHITLVDHDTVDLTNLQRQIATPWTAWASPRWRRQRRPCTPSTPRCRSPPSRSGPMPHCWKRLVQQASVVLDCSDNYATRQAVNAACVRLGKPLVAGAVIRFDAQISVFDPRDPQSPAMPASSTRRRSSRRWPAPPWGVCTAGRRRGRHAGSRSSQADIGRRTLARRTLADAGRAPHGMERPARSAQPRLRGVRPVAWHGHCGGLKVGLRLHPGVPSLAQSGPNRM